MLRYLPALLLAAVVAPARADDTIPTDTLKALKDATVFVKVKAGPVGGTGSGFVIRVDGETALVATNHHVVDVPALPGRPAPGPVTVTLVFYSGTKREVTAVAEVLGSDSSRDL